MIFDACEKQAPNHLYYVSVGPSGEKKSSVRSQLENTYQKTYEDFSAVVAPVETDFKPDKDWMTCGAPGAIFAACLQGPGGPKPLAQCQQMAVGGLKFDYSEAFYTLQRPAIYVSKHLELYWASMHYVRQFLDANFVAIVDENSQAAKKRTRHCHYLSASERFLQ